MSGLRGFLLANPVGELEKEIILSRRLADHPFRISSMNAEEVEAYLQTARAQGKGGHVNGHCFQMLMVLNHTLEPDFRDAGLLDEAGCVRPEDFVNQHLLAGEIASLARQIAALSGYDKDFAALRQEVKN